MYYTKGSVDLSFLGSELERILRFSSVFPSLVCSWIRHLRQGLKDCAVFSASLHGAVAAAVSHSTHPLTLFFFFLPIIFYPKSSW
ncbi:unnamed protein product [Musa acuminata subsp. malaccensis]|uniref:(wild Malaysian banana) hypothetical protein n=1 Tax=Musa acuminata subsp. malaccensis TaxID=214687 RepID=A0A8D7EUY9_MUSAM|nr:unnamed protein product [Musa acuminata subsp. malaccensis]